MRQVPNFGDKRNQGFCVHCGGSAETVDHAPSKVFLDEPYPENLAGSPSCGPCNNGFSLDEAYLACLLECTMAGTTEPSAFARSKVAGMLRKNPKLKERLEGSRQIVGENIIWNPERDRVERVLVKLARCHVAFEYNEPQLQEPTNLTYMPLHTMTSGQREYFEGRSRSSEEFGGWPEVGSRAMSRIFAINGVLHVDDWLEVQEERYRFQVSQEQEGITVRVLLRGYLACVVAWE